MSRARNWSRFLLPRAADARAENRLAELESQEARRLAPKPTPPKLLPAAELRPLHLVSRAQWSAPKAYCRACGLTLDLSQRYSALAPVLPDAEWDEALRARDLRDPKSKWISCARRAP